MTEQNTPKMTHDEMIDTLKGLVFGTFDRTTAKEREALEMAIKELEQGPRRDMEEIREVMSCDADAETKCKMISNILTAKPHYFEKQEPCGETVSLEAFKQVMWERDIAIAQLKELGYGFGQKIEPKTWHWINGDDKCPCCGKSKFKDLDADIWSDWRPNYCPNCGAKMVEPQESDIHCNFTDAEIAKSFIEDVEAVKDLLPQESDHKCHTCKHYTSGEHDGSCGSYICKEYSNWESEG